VRVGVKEKERVRVRVRKVMESSRLRIAMVVVLTMSSDQSLTLSALATAATHRAILPTQSKQTQRTLTQPPFCSFLPFAHGGLTLQTPPNGRFNPARSVQHRQLTFPVTLRPSLASYTSHPVISHFPGAFLSSSFLLQSCILLRHSPLAKSTSPLPPTRLLCTVSVKPSS